MAFRPPIRIADAATVAMTETLMTARVIISQVDATQDSVLNYNGIGLFSLAGSDTTAQCAVVEIKIPLKQGDKVFADNCDLTLIFD